jgi:hypothetical protein
MEQGCDEELCLGSAAAQAAAVSKRSSDVNPAVLKQQLAELQPQEQKQEQQQAKQAQLLLQVRSLAGTHYSSWGQQQWAAVLAYEDAVRLSAETQAAYEAAEQHSSSKDWLDVTEGLQRRVLAEAGLSSKQMPAGLASMRGAPYRWAVTGVVCDRQRCCGQGQR